MLQAMRTQVIILTLLGAILGGTAKDVFPTAEDKIEGESLPRNSNSLERQTRADLEMNKDRRGYKKRPGKKSKISCTPAPLCSIIGCGGSGICIGVMCCTLDTAIVKTPEDERCYEPCNLSGPYCPTRCPYCIQTVEGGTFRCWDESGLINKAEVYLDKEIDDLSSSDLAEFKSTNTECSWWKCGVKVLKALYYCHKECSGTSGCIIPCAKKILAAAEECWPCLKKGCCILGLSCCSMNTDEELALKSPLEGNKDLVVIGGDNGDNERLDSGEYITPTGVCETKSPRKIQPLLHKTTAGGLVWMDDNTSTYGLLVFCGGSRTFVPGTSSIRNYGATDLCYSMKPGDSQWSTVAINDMTKARSWFSLTKVSDNPGEIIAAGGIDEDGNMHKSVEKYSFNTKTWDHYLKLSNPRFGHCAVHYTKDSESYLILIGGSTKVPRRDNWRPTKSVVKIDLKDGSKHTFNSLPKGLWRPACTITNDYIYVSGGSSGNRRYAQRGVYRYSFENEKWSTMPIGNLIRPRWGAVMGTTSNGPYGQLIVAGGYNPYHQSYYNDVERSNDGGFTWSESYPNLNEGREYASVAEVKPGTFTC